MPTSCCPCCRSCFRIGVCYLMLIYLLAAAVRAVPCRHSQPMGMHKGEGLSAYMDSTRSRYVKVASNLHERTQGGECVDQKAGIKLRKTQLALFRLRARGADSRSDILLDQITLILMLDLMDLSVYSSQGFMNCTIRSDQRPPVAFGWRSIFRIGNTRDPPHFRVK